MTICHVTPAGVKQTFVLPRSAALAHLATHPLDTVGTCPVEVDPEVEAKSIKKTK